MAVAMCAHSNPMSSYMTCGAPMPHADRYYSLEGTPSPPSVPQQNVYYDDDAFHSDEEIQKVIDKITKLIAISCCRESALLLFGSPRVKATACGLLLL